MSAPEVTVWVQPLGSGWVPVGADLGVELIPQSVTYERVRLGGSSSASFDVRRDTRAAWSDLGPFTPVLIELGGVPVWRGRIAATPKTSGSERVWTVQCEGMYAHLNDDLTNRRFVHDGSAGWVDARTMPGQTTVWQAFNGEVTNTLFGQIMLRVPRATVVPASANLGVFFDAGPGNVIESVYIDWTSSANDASANLLLGSSTDGTDSYDESVTVSALSVASGTHTETWDTPRRYVAISYSRSAGTTYGADLYVIIKEVRVVTRAAYLSSGDSTLTVSDVLRTDLAECCPLISDDTDLISDTSTIVPHFWPDTYGTPRERLESLLAVEPYQFTLLPEAVPRAKLTAIPTKPVWVYDAGTDGGSVDGGGANDGQEMFSHAVVSYTNSLGVRADTTFSTETGSITFSNGTFDTNTTGWSGSAINAGTTISRVTSPTYGGAGALQLAASAGAVTVDAATSSYSAELKIGRTYTIKFWYRAAQTSSAVALYDADEATLLAVIDDAPVNGAWRQGSYTFTATDTAPNLAFLFESTTTYSAAAAGYVDEFTIELHSDTLVERRGFRRTIALESDVSTSTAAEAQADAFLATAQYPPFKGSIAVTGYARKYGTDEYIPVGQIPDGDAMLVCDESNPSIGSVGRVGIIERVVYSHDALTAQLDLDSRQDLLDQIVLARRGL